MKQLFVALLIFIASSTWSQDSTRVNHDIDSITRHCETEIKLRNSVIEQQRDQAEIAGDLIMLQAEDIKTLTNENNENKRKSAVRKKLCIGLSLVVICETVIIVKIVR